MDYLLEKPEYVLAVDINPYQSALLDLKIAAIRTLEFDDFFDIFGYGRSERFNRLYVECLRENMNVSSRAIWDKYGEKIFSGRGLYFSGTTGISIRIFRFYFSRIKKLMPVIERFLQSEDLEQQNEIFSKELETYFTRYISILFNSSITMFLHGVPPEQRSQTEKEYGKNIGEVYVMLLRKMLTSFFIKDNYFAYIVLNGGFTRECCPEYLKPKNFQALKSGLIDRLETRTCDVLSYLKTTKRKFSHFALLDHMDWLSYNNKPYLQDEWQHIWEASMPHGKVLARSLSRSLHFYQDLEIHDNGKIHKLSDLFSMNNSRLIEEDRSSIYGSVSLLEKASQP